MQYMSRPENSVGYPGTGVTSSGRPCYVGDGNQTLGLSTRTVLLTAIKPYHLP